MAKDACYHKVKAQYDVFPSARASQAIAKCRKGKGQVRKPSKRVSSKTPKTKGEMSASEKKKKVSEKKSVGRGRKVSNLNRRRGLAKKVRGK